MLRTELDRAEICLPAGADGDEEHAEHRTGRWRMIAGGCLSVIRNISSTLLFGPDSRLSGNISGNRLRASDMVERCKLNISPSRHDDDSVPARAD
ncbi:MAG: hypothetical protein WBO17_06330 [Sphingorhabdus sp.]